MQRLPSAPDIEWTDETTLRARGFNDVYFSRAGGLAESEAVFLAGCGLPQAWFGKDRYAIGELGFGTGLNALAVWRAWRFARRGHAVLHMTSVEAFPLARADAERALAAFPDVAPLAERLLANWPARAAAPQRLWFEEDGFCLTLLIDEAAHALTGLEGRFDAWFLDGFAPARNPAMWTTDVMARIAALSAPGARVATYSVAGDVRRALEAAGFAVEKKPGFAGKRERLEATLQTSAPLQRLFPYAASNPKRVAIIGAGIAGAATAAALARRNIETIVLDAAREPASGASGNPAGLVMPRLDRAGALAEVHLAAYLAAVRAYEALGAFEQTGVLERPEPRGAEAFTDFLADPPLPPDWYAPQNADEVLHARAGLVRPREAIAAWLKRSSFIGETEITGLDRIGDHWRLIAPGGRAIVSADAVVLACGPALTRLDAAKFLPLRITRGQLEWGRGAPPTHAITRGSYCAPFEGGVLFGATFDKQSDDAGPEADADSRARNIAALETLAPDIAARLARETLNSRAALRAAAADFAPIAGLMPDAPAWLERYARIAHGRAPDLSAPPPVLDGVYVLGGLGARGLTLAPLLGERIVSEMLGEPQLLSSRALDAIHPSRFLRRQLKKKRA